MARSDPPNVIYEQIRRRTLGRLLEGFGPDLTAGLIVSAVRSPVTPPFAETVVRLYKRLSRRRRVEMLRLIAAEAAGWTLAGQGEGLSLRIASGRPSPEELEWVAEAASRIAASERDRDAVILEKFAERPRLFLNLDVTTRRHVWEQLSVYKNEYRAPSAVEAIAPNSGPAGRYATVQVFHEEPSARRGSELEKGASLRARSRYQAIVSIRTKPIGLEPVEARRPIREPRQTRDVDIFITAEADDSAFKVTPLVQHIVLPPQGDARGEALFQIRPLRATDAGATSVIRFRFFYKFNLLERVTLRSGILPADELEEAVSPLKPLELSQARLADCNDFDLIKPAGLNIDIEPYQGQFRLTFTYPGVDELHLTAVVTLNAIRLAERMHSARETLFRISACERFSKDVDATPEEYADHIRSLAIEGRDLWATMFETGPSESMAEIGKWLRSNPMPAGAKIQVSNEPDDAGFVFAWNLLYDLPLGKDDTPQSNGFWGLRYVIEQRIAHPIPPENPCDTIKIGAMYWKFAQTPAQHRFLQELLGRTNERAFLVDRKPIDDAGRAEELLHDGGGQLLYFFTHGHTRQPGGDAHGVTVKDFMKLFEALPEDSSTRTAWTDLYNSIKDRTHQNDRTWIQMQYGKLDLLEILTRVPRNSLSGQPLVILNMCESAQVTPSLAESFIEFFLTRGARAVVGTECSMRPVFADFAARSLLPALFRGETIGEALLKMRLSAVEGKKNMLGLAYTLFGVADAALQPPLLGA